MLIHCTIAACRAPAGARTRTCGLGIHRDLLFTTGAPQEGIEPTAFRVEAGRSLRLSYWGMLVVESGTVQS